MDPWADTSIGIENIDTFSESTVSMGICISKVTITADLGLVGKLRTCPIQNGQNWRISNSQSAKMWYRPIPFLNVCIKRNSHFYYLNFIQI